MSALTPEIGSPGNLTGLWRPTADGGKMSYTPDPPEHTWDLRWPLNVPVFEEMRRSDGQIGSLLRAMTNPIVSANWTLDERGVTPEVTEFVKRQIGLQDTGEAQRRKRRAGVVWAEHVQGALSCLTFGHAFFEQVYRYDPTDQMIHLRKLALRPANTITDIQVAPDGGLEGIWQTSTTPTTPYGVMIPVDNLVAYALEREGADWTGNSILRTAYKHWLIRDQLIRIDAQSIERNRMGIPVIEYDPTDPNAKDEAERIVSEVRAGESAGVVVPTGSNFKLVGVTGSTADAIPSLNWHDQAISRAALAMFLNLGHDAGARSLGETFQRFFIDALQAVADLIAATATEHIVRDLVEINFGPDEPYPILSPGRLSSAEATAASLSSLTSAGLLTPDPGLEEYLRDTMGLPKLAASDGTDVLHSMPASEFNQRANAAGVLIRSGFDPASSMEQAGLPPVDHLGLLPVTVQPPAKGTDLENAVDPDEDEGVPQSMTGRMAALAERLHRLSAQEEV